MGVPAHPQLRDHPLKAEGERGHRRSRGRWCGRPALSAEPGTAGGDLSRDTERREKVQDEAISESGACSGHSPDGSKSTCVRGPGMEARSRRALREAGTTGPEGHQYTCLPQTKGGRDLRRW